MSFESESAGSAPLQTHEQFLMAEDVKRATDFPDLLLRLSRLATFAKDKDAETEYEHFKIQEDLVRQLTEAMSGTGLMPVTEEHFTAISTDYGIRETADRLFGEWRQRQQS